MILQTLSEIVEVPFQLVLFSLPPLGYAVYLSRKGTSTQKTLERLGMRGCGWRHIGLAFGIAVLIGTVGILVELSLLGTIEELSSTKTEISLSFAQYRGWEPGVAALVLIFLREAVYTTLGEEVFFRGFLGGILFRQFGFRAGNTLQTGIFILPHLVLVWVAPQLWPMVGVWGLAGWLLGWLYYRTETVIPGWVAHTVVNTAASYMFLLL